MLYFHTKHIIINSSIFALNEEGWNAQRETSKAFSPSSLAQSCPHTHTQAFFSSSPPKLRTQTTHPSGFSCVSQSLRNAVTSPWSSCPQPMISSPSVDPTHSCVAPLFRPPEVTGNSGNYLSFRWSAFFFRLFLVRRAQMRARGFSEGDDLLKFMEQSTFRARRFTLVLSRQWLGINFANHTKNICIIQPGPVNRPANTVGPLSREPVPAQLVDYCVNNANVMHSTPRAGT